MPKNHRIAEMLATRIEHGDYALRPFPNEVQLAAELSASRTTIRRAVQHLVDRRLLTRKANGRLALARETGAAAGPFSFAFLAPAFSSINIDRWRSAAEHAGVRIGARVRPIDYVHWDDPVLQESFEGFDGCFLLPITEPMPPGLIRRITETKGRLAILEHDMTEHGIPCAVSSSDEIPLLLDHLRSLGHEAVECFNTQPMDEVIDRRIRSWQDWRDKSKFQGELLSEPVPHYGDAMEQAYRVGSRLLARKTIRTPSAVVCTTSHAAFGLMRAVADAGLNVGSDVSVCSMLDEGIGRYTCPSVTSLQMPDVLPMLVKLAEWMHAGGTNWKGPLMVKPERPSDQLFLGESTRPPSSSMGRSAGRRLTGASRGRK